MLLIKCNKTSNKRTPLFWHSQPRSDKWSYRIWKTNLKNKFFFLFADNLNEFGLSGQHYRSPRLVLLGLIKRVQEEKYLREKRARIPNNSSSQDISLEQFNYAKGIGQFAVNVYYASWYWKKIIKLDLIKSSITLLDFVLDISKNISYCWNAIFAIQNDD